MAQKQCLKSWIILRGFKFSTFSGITWGIDDVVIPSGKEEIVKKGLDEVLNINDKFEEGLLSEEEKYDY